MSLDELRIEYCYRSWIQSMKEIITDGLINLTVVSMIEEYNEIKNFFFSYLQITEIPKLTLGFTGFIESGEQILEKRKMNQTLLANPQ